MKTVQNIIRSASMGGAILWICMADNTPISIQAAWLVAVLCGFAAAGDLKTLRNYW